LREATKQSIAVMRLKIASLRSQRGHAKTGPFGGAIAFAPCLR
jgi:hypothetical protein